MGDMMIKEPQLVEEAQERVVFSTCAVSIEEPAITRPPPQPAARNKRWWAWMIIYTSFVLVGQSSATLLGRLYYNKGGNTILLAALLETVGFPILIPFAFYLSSNHPSNKNNNNNDQYHLPSNYYYFMILSAVYIFIGLFQAASGVLYAIGLQNLPVSIYSLTSTTQLGFSAFFSFFLNAQKFTFLILNALVLVTLSSTLLIFQRDNESSSDHDQDDHFLLGFSCTLMASALYSLTLSMTQLVFNKVIKRETFSTVLNMVIYQSLVSNCVVMAALFISGEWLVLRKEMEDFEMGKLLYVVVVLMIAVGWQVYSIGAVGLIFEVSSLFSNVISTVGLPVVPILAAVFFNEKMDGIKVVSIFLAVWGFVSYVYQNYLKSDVENHVKVAQVVQEIESS